MYVCMNVCFKLLRIGGQEKETTAEDGDGQEKETTTDDGDGQEEETATEDGETEIRKYISEFSISNIFLIIYIFFKEQQQQQTTKLQDYR